MAANNSLLVRVSLVAVKATVMFHCDILNKHGNTRASFFFISGAAAATNKTPAANTTKTSCLLILLMLALLSFTIITLSVTQQLRPFRVMLESFKPAYYVSI